MDYIAKYTPFLVSLLCTAYPILLQVVTKLDERYSSALIVELFNTEWKKKFYVLSLKTGLAILLIWTIQKLWNSQFQPLIDLGIINNAGDWLLLISSIILVVAFFHFVIIILDYYLPTKLVKHLIDKYNAENNSENQIKIFNALADIYYFSIKQQYENISFELVQFMNIQFKVFNERRIDDKNYPVDYYSFLFRSTEMISSQKNVKTEINNSHKQIIKLLLIGNKISEPTFRWLWMILRHPLKHQNDDMLVDYWTGASNYLSSKLYNIPEEYQDNLNPLQITNALEIKQRKKERDRFLEFHFALGGLLLLEKRYKCINRFFNYSPSDPPKYELLPDTVDEILKWYIEFIDPYERRNPFIQTKYPFPEMEGLMADRKIKNWICKYLALLLLRQYTLVPYLSYMNFLELLNVPQKQSEKTFWLSNLSYFKKLINEILKNDELLELVGMGHMKQNWFTDNQKPHPTEIIDNAIEKIKAAYEYTQINQPLSVEKVQKFKDTSKEILLRIIPKYEVIKGNINQSNDNLEYNSFYIHGINYVWDKNDYLENSDSSSDNHDSFPAGSLSKNYGVAFHEVFHINASIHYLIKHDEVMEAIHRLKINTSHVIIGFGQNLYSYNSLLIEKGKPILIDGVELFNFDYINPHLGGASFFILKRDDLPQLIHHKLEREVIEKYQYHDEIDENYHLYASVVPIYGSEALIEEVSSSPNPPQDIRKSLIVSIGMLTELRWKKNINCICITTASEFYRQGIINSIDDVNPVD